MGEQGVRLAGGDAAPSWLWMLSCAAVPSTSPFQLHSNPQPVQMAPMEIEPGATVQTETETRILLRFTD